MLTKGVSSRALQVRPVAMNTSRRRELAIVARRHAMDLDLAEPLRATRCRRMPALQPLVSENLMAESIYKIIEIVGTSTESWEKAAAGAVAKASKTLRDLRVAEVEKLDMQIKDGKVEAYRAKLKVSFKFED
jgi:hypothetical protein